MTSKVKCVTSPYQENNISLGGCIVFTQQCSFIDKKTIGSLTKFLGD